MKTLRKSAALALMTFAAGAWLAAPWAAAASKSSGFDGKWLHIRVDSKEAESGSPEIVRVNLPLSMIHSMMPYLKDQALKETEGERIELGDHDLDMKQLRALWDAAKETGNAEFVSVQSEGESVKVARDGGQFLIKVRGDAREDKPAESVDVRIPVDVVDALFSGEGEELNFEAAIQALARQTGADLILVNDGSDRVRIWIDSSGSTD